MSNLVAECPECKHVCDYLELLVEDHPFKYPRMAGVKEKIYGCPECEYAFEEITWVEKDDE